MQFFKLIFVRKINLFENFVALIFRNKLKYFFLKEIVVNGGVCFEIGTDRFLLIFAHHLHFVPRYQLHISSPCQ